MNADDREHGAEPYRASSASGAVPLWDPRNDPRLQAIARRHRLIIVHKQPTSCPHLLQDGGRLALASGDSSELPFTIDWAIPPRSRGEARPALLRAMGHHLGIRDVLDATAGLARDAARLARARCRVRMVERHPVLAALIEDALDQADAPDDLSLLLGDAKTVLETLPGDQRPEAIHIDPMLPPRARGAAAVKKEIRVLKELLGADEDAAALLDVARSVATRRVAVKRPMRAPPLGGHAPDAKILSTRLRWDVYLR